MTLEQIQYPNGKWVAKDQYSPEEIKQNIEEILIYPLKYRDLTENLSDDDLEKTYREGSWTIRQLVHHVADTHLWHFIRLKHALTEENPVGFMANVNAFAALPDGNKAPVEDSLQMISSTHGRYGYLFAQLSESDYQRTYFHPFRQLSVNLPQAIDMVLWHAKHHYEHIRIALGEV
jgi:uncharacterized damage-inducible protein DinB